MDVAERQIGIGDNQPPIFDRLSMRLDELLASSRKAAVDFPEVTDQATADRYKGFIDQLKDICGPSGTAEKTRQSEVKPLNDQVTEINLRWSGLKAKAKLAVDFLSPRLEKFLKAEAARIEKEAAEKRRLAEEAKQKLLDQQKEAERLAEEANAGELAGTKADPIEAANAAQTLTQTVKDLEKDARRAEVAKPKAGSDYIGTSGRARSAGLTNVRTAVIKDYALALAHFAHTTEVKELIQTLAQRSVRARLDVPGVEVDENKELRT